MCDTNKSMSSCNTTAGRSMAGDTSSSRPMASDVKSFDAKSSVVGVFATRAQAQQAVSELRGMGFRDDQIGLVAKDDADRGPAHSGLPNDPTHTRWEEGTGIGAAAGAATGTGLGLAVAAGLLTPVGPIIAGGALVALLASAGAGATVGTLVGGLIGLGVPEDDAEYYEGELRSGRYVVSVNAGDRASEARLVFQRFESFDRSAAAARPASDAPRTLDERPSRMAKDTFVAEKPIDARDRERPMKVGSDY